MLKTIIFGIMSLLLIPSFSFASDEEPDINQAFRVYDKYTGELIVNVAFEPVLIEGDGYEYVIMTICDMHGYCAAYEFENRILLEKINIKDIIR